MPHRAKHLAWLILFAAIDVASGADPDVDLFNELSARAEAGSAEAQYHLGMLYNNGIGTAQDPKAAFPWFEKAAGAGDPLAQFKVGCYYAGQFPGAVPLDKEKALASKLQSAEAGYSLAQYDVAQAYYEAKDYGSAVKWWSAAAAQGEPLSLIMLAMAHEKGFGVTASFPKTYEYLLTAKRALPGGKLAPVAEEFISRLKQGLDPTAAANAERAAREWAPQPTELTLRAGRGLEEARRIVR